MLPNFFSFPTSKHSDVSSHISRLFTLSSTVVCGPIILSFPTSKHSDVYYPISLISPSKYGDVYCHISLISHFQGEWCVLRYFSAFPLPSLVMYAHLFLPVPTSQHSDVCSHTYLVSHFQAQFSVLPYVILPLSTSKHSGVLPSLLSRRMHRLCSSTSPSLPLPSTVL